MSGTEYAIADAVVTGQLRSGVATTGSVLIVSLKVFLAGWAIMAGVALLREISRRKYLVRMAIIAVLLMSQMVLAEEMAQTSQPMDTVPKSKGAALTYSLVGTLAAGRYRWRDDVVWSRSGGQNGTTIAGLLIGSAGSRFRSGRGTCIRRPERTFLRRRGHKGNSRNSGSWGGHRPGTEF